MPWNDSNFSKREESGEESRFLSEPVESWEAKGLEKLVAWRNGTRDRPCEHFSFRTEEQPKLFIFFFY